MISYNEFLTKVEENIYDYLPAELQDVKVESMSMKKYLSDSYEGLSISRKGSKQGYGFDPKDIYAGIESEEELPAAYSLIARLIMQFVKMKPVDLDQIYQDVDFFKEHLALTVSNRECCQDILDDVPHRIYDEMALLYKIMVPQPDGSLLGTVVTNDMIRKYEMSPDDLYGAAINNCQEMFPLELIELGGEDAEFYFATTCNERVGSGCIFYPDFIYDVGRKTEGNFYIVPFATFGALIVKDTEDLDPAFLKHVAFDMSTTQAGPSERLSKKIYYCHLKEGVITRVGENVN